MSTETLGHFLYEREFPLVFATPGGVSAQEEEDEDGGGADGPLSASVSGSKRNDLVGSFQHWVSRTRNKQYRFIALVLASDKSILEIALREHIRANYSFYSTESGPDLLIVHDVDRSGTRSLEPEAFEAVIAWLKQLEVGRLGLPYWVVFRHFQLSEDKTSDEAFVFSMNEGASKWSGTHDEFFLTIFRALFDAVDAVPSDSTKQIRRLEKEFKTRFSKVVGINWTDKATKVANLPLIGHILSALSLTV